MILAFLEVLLAVSLVPWKPFGAPLAPLGFFLRGLLGVLLWSWSSVGGFSIRLDAIVLLWPFGLKTCTPEIGI